MQRTQDDARRVTLGLASPERIRQRSCGEVHKPSTIDSRTYHPQGGYVPEVGGLFCQKIFGPVKDWQCRCGAYRGKIHEGTVCGKCSVEITRRVVRRERMGHIELGVPVVHPWYFRRGTNIIGRLLGLKRKNLRKIIYRERFVVIQPGSAKEVKQGQLLSGRARREIRYLIRADNDDLEDGNPEKFIARTGGEAVEMMLKRLDLSALALELHYQIQTETSQERRSRALKRLSVVRDVQEANRRATNKPEWMVLHRIPVIPPEMRPLVPLKNGRFATGDLNRLYQRVIIRNQKIKRLAETGTPAIILRKEKRMLQEAVDALFDGGRNPRFGQSRALKPLPNRLKGKEGRFRQNLLGKRVDYSGRTVIVAGPDLELHQCGLPKAMALELFRPFLVRELVKTVEVARVEIAKLAEAGGIEAAEEISGDERRFIRQGRAVAEEIVDIKARPARAILEDVGGLLKKVVRRRPVLLNRQPTLHRLGIQAFQPVLIGGHALRLHPLVCAAFNADFDGDQMAVHVPLSDAACQEVKRLMRPAYNILGPADGQPHAVPSQDMLLGLYYLTKAGEGEKGEGKRFSSVTEVRQAFDHGAVALHSKIKLRDPDGSDKRLDTTTGRALFNEIVPGGIGFVNEVLTKKSLPPIIARVFKKNNYRTTARFLDAMKSLGFEHATRAGHTFSLADLPIPSAKHELVAETWADVQQINAAYENDQLSEKERYERVINAWTQADSRLSKLLFQRLKEDKSGFNTIYMMADSGARGSKEQIRQLAGMRGLMTKLQKKARNASEEYIEHPIRSNLKEGLSVLEYFISARGGRKGLADTALKTADAGYLTRRLVDVAQDVTVTEADCGTLRGIKVSAFQEGVAEPLAERILGRVSLHDVCDPLTDELLVEANQLIDEQKAKAIAETFVEEVEIRSVLACETRRGVCAACYGHDLTTGERVTVGTPVGVIAAQSIGEPGTQLTLRTFHTGGAKEEGGDITGGLPRVEELFEARTPSDPVEISEISGTVSFGRRTHDALEVIVTSSSGGTRESYMVHDRTPLAVQEGDTIRSGAPLREGRVDPHDVLAIEGLRATQQHLAQEIQKVYRSQGVTLDAKHTEIVIRTMTEHIEIEDPGDTGLLEGELVIRLRLESVNNDLAHGARPAVGKPVLLGITNAALEAGSWLSAAGFQSTTTVLARAAVRAQEDLLHGMKGKVILGRPSDLMDLVVGPVPFWDILTVERAILLRSAVVVPDTAHRTSRAHPSSAAKPERSAAAATRAQHD